MSDGFLDVLVSRARLGDREAWRELYLRLMPRMRGAAVGFAGVDAEGVVHDVFLACCTRGFPGYRGGNLVSYALRAVRNRCIDETRRRCHGDLPLDALPGRGMANCDPGPEERVVNEDLIAWAMASARVSVRDEALLRLESAGWSHAEIASREAMTAGQVSVRLHRARKRLRRLATAHRKAAPVGAHPLGGGKGMLATACRPSPSSSPPTRLPSPKPPPGPSPTTPESGAERCARPRSSKVRCGRRSPARASTCTTPATSTSTSAAISAE